MTNRKKQILGLLEKENRKMDAGEIASILAIDRSNISRYLNELYKENMVKKIEGRPVLFTLIENDVEKNQGLSPSFENLVGNGASLKVSIQQAKAAILYPPSGLHTIIFGETGTGKSLFAECMFNFAIESEILVKNAPFITFNCADYAQNPQLLFAQIFGVKKGAYTDAVEDRQGLIAKSDQGILFLDEIHRLPPEGQEMLFTFIDKGIYRPLGESNKTYQANVRIIGATTESADAFLNTFNRRIPMSINLPALRNRTIDERYEVVAQFMKQEANRLEKTISLEREVMLAFMLYEAEGNIGQVKRDLKLVCAKAFLNYRTQQLDRLIIRQKELPLTVQKGLLKIKEFSGEMDQFIEKNRQYISFEPGALEVVWSQDPSQNMDVYNKINEKVESLSQSELETFDLETLIAQNVEGYFQTYITELTSNDIYQEMTNQKIWELANQLYNLAAEQLGRSFSKSMRFALALHLQSTIERIRTGRTIVHPDLNNIRKHYSKEFQIAIDLSGIVEDKLDIDIPFDEIGFITMFLAVDIGEKQQEAQSRVAVIVMMHGKSTASSMLEAVQDLLNIPYGQAINMPLTMEVREAYEQLKEYVGDNVADMKEGLLLLTDMGSLNTFGNMIFEELGVRTKVITMASTMNVLEAVRMASIGRSLEDIYQSIQFSFQGMLKEQFKITKDLKKAIVVTCFTGEGVAKKMYDRIQPLTEEQSFELITLQYLEKNNFKKRIDDLMKKYEIQAIVGTVEVTYQNIPFFSALDIFNDEKFELFKKLVIQDIPTEQIILTLDGMIKNVDSVQKLVLLLKKVTHQIEIDCHFSLEKGVNTGIVLHLAFLVDTLLTKSQLRTFPHLDQFKKEHRMEMDIVHTHLLLLEKQYRTKIPESEVAYVTQMFTQNNQVERIDETK